MAQRSEIDRRAKRYAPRQCVSDYGMHKDAPEKPAKRRLPLRNIHSHDGLWTCTDPDCEDWR